MDMCLCRNVFVFALVSRVHSVNLELFVWRQTRLMSTDTIDHVDGLIDASDEVKYGRGIQSYGHSGGFYWLPLCLLNWNSYPRHSCTMINNIIFTIFFVKNWTTIADEVSVYDSTLKSRENSFTKKCICPNLSSILIPFKITFSNFWIKNDNYKFHPVLSKILIRILKDYLQQDA